MSRADDSKNIASGSAYNPPSRKTIPPFEASPASAACDPRSLNRDHAVITRHLKALEQWTCARLVERTPRSIVLTDETTAIIRSRWSMAWSGRLF